MLTSSFTESRPPKTSHFPSGVQDSPATPIISVSLRSGPPSGEINMIATLPCPADARERDPAVIRRPGGIGLCRRVRGQPHGGSRRADLLDVDVGVVFLLAVPDERHLVAVRRERRLRLDAGIGGERTRPEVAGGGDAPRSCQTSMRPTSSTAAAGSGSPQPPPRRVRSAAGTPASLPESDSSFSSSSATFTSSMCWKRRAGSLRRQRAMTLLQVVRHLGRRAAAAPCEDRRQRRQPSSRRNARRPVTISYSTDPKLKMSERASTFFPSACSGDM